MRHWKGITQPWSHVLAYTLLVQLCRPSAAQPAPVMAHVNFPDPSILWAEGKWWAFATGNSATHISVASAVDWHGTWTLEANADGSRYDALPTLPAWVNLSNPHPWAPSVNVLDDGSYLMYFSAAKQGDNPANVTHCLSAAKATDVRGPYSIVKDVLACPGDSYGAIDVAGFKDWEVKGNWDLPQGSQFGNRPLRCNSRFSGNGRGGCGNSYLDPQWSEGGQGGKRYIVYKVQNADLAENPQITKTPLTLQEVDATDGITLLGDPVRLLDNDGSSDNNNIEAPVLFKSADAATYYLFFSRGSTFIPEYTASYAVSDSLTGPYVRKGDLLKAGDFGGLNGPGGADINWNGEQFAFHGIDAPIGAPYPSRRVLYAGDVSIDGDTVTVVDI